MLASALCLIICPNSVSAGGAANAAPAQVKSARRGKLQGFPRVVAHTAPDRSSVRVVIRIAGMQFSRNSEGHSEPLTVLPKIAFGEYPYFEEFSKNFLRSRQDAVSPLDDRPLADAHSLGVFPCRRAVEEQGVDEFPVGIL